MSAERAWLSEGAAAWPEVDPSVVETLPTALLTEPADRAERWLALACVAGSSAAMRAFEVRYLDSVEGVLQQRGLSADERAEMRQRIRVRLFVAQREGSAVVLHYAGQGRLGGLVRVVAIREAARLRSGIRPRALSPDDLGGRELDLRVLDRRQQRLAKGAFERAAEGLTRRDRTILRLHYARGVSGPRLATMYGVHRGTAARWIESARINLLRRFLDEVESAAPELGVRERQRFDTWFRSNVELTLSRVFKTAA